MSLRIKISFFAFLLVSAICLFFRGYAFAEEDKEVSLYLFWANGCPHCAKEELFLSKLEDKYPTLNVHKLEVTQSKENALLLKKTADELGVSASGVPFTVIGDKYFVGYLSDETTGKQIEDEIKCVIKSGCQDIVAGLTGTQSPVNQKEQSSLKKINIPVLGMVNLERLSLPFLAVVLGLLDGFNPCAMWILLFLISLLLRMENKAKRWVLGGVFIAASAFVYFLFLTAWLKLFQFLSLIKWIRAGIGAVALGTGLYSFYKYYQEREGGCKAANAKNRDKVFEQLKDAVGHKSFPLAVVSLVILAFAINLFELICSAGLPAVFTQVLSMSRLVSWQRYFYIVIYIFFYMLNELVVFFIAMITAEAVGIESKWGQLSRLLGGVVMLIIGFLLFFRPGLLMFG